MVYSRNVFINCPFDDEYYQLLKPILFTVIYCGYNPLISETSNSNSIRIENIKSLIEQSKFSIHDISRIELSNNGLPRFNMPYELGIDVGCKAYFKKDKVILILDNDPYVYKQVISDISGQDISSHKNEPSLVVKAIRDWFSKNVSKSLFQYTKIWDDYNEFNGILVSELVSLNMNPDSIWEVPFSETVTQMKTWIKSNH